MTDRQTVSARAAAAFGDALEELTVVVDERLALDAKFECRAAPCDRLELARDTSHQFGRLLSAVYRFGLEPELEPEFGWYATFLGRRGFSFEFTDRFLEAWLVAVNSGLPAKDAAELRAPLDRLRGRLGLLLEGQRPEPALPPEAAGLAELLVARRRRAAAEALLALAAGGRPVDELIEQVVLPAVARVGLLWETAAINVADEHAATEVCRYALYRLFDSLPGSRPTGRKALAACVPGEEHALGAEAVAEYLQYRGWDVFPVGRSAPEADIVQALARYRPDVAFLSVTMVANLLPVPGLVAAAAAALPASRLVFGGRAAAKAADALRALGAGVAQGLEEAHAAGLRRAGGNA